MIIGEIEHLLFEDGIEEKDGWLNLEKAETIAINGLDGYTETHLIDRFDHAKPNKEVNSIFMEGNNDIFIEKSICPMFFNAFVPNNVWFQKTVYVFFFLTRSYIKN